MLDWFKQKVTPVHLMSVAALAIVSGLAFTQLISGEAALSFIGGAILGVVGSSVGRKSE